FDNVVKKEEIDDEEPESSCVQVLPQPKFVSCWKCAKKFISRNYLNKHMINHSAFPNFVSCSKSTKKFVSQDCLNEHMKNHTAINQSCD
ncbi:hypothetical protein PMAYCL1PPCAC_22402, partial [Pristionchus mayeri]